MTGERSAVQATTERRPQAPEIVRVSIDGVRRRAELADSWLSPAERATLEGLTIAKRRHEWLAGRIAAKLVVRRSLAARGRTLPEPWDVDVRSRESGWQRGRPIYLVRGRPATRCLSIAHAGDFALAALASRTDRDVGIDYEPVRARAAGFESVALGAAELRRLRGIDGETRARAVALSWVLKEALVKALGAGLRVPLAAIRVDLDPSTRRLAPRPFEITRGDGLLALLRRFSTGATAAHFRLADGVGAWVELPRRGAA